MPDQSPMAQAQQPQTPTLFGGNPTPVGGIGAIARMLGIGSEPGVGRALQNAGAALQAPGNWGRSVVPQAPQRCKKRRTSHTTTSSPTRWATASWLTHATAQVMSPSSCGHRPTGPALAAGGAQPQGMSQALAQATTTACMDSESQKAEREQEAQPR